MSMSGRGRGKRIVPKVPEMTENKIPIKEDTSVKDDTSIKDSVPVKANKPIKEDKPAKKLTKKKQFPVIAFVGPDGIEGNLLPEQRRPLIVHLHIQSKDVPMNDMPIIYDPHPPNDAQPYDINADNPFYEAVEHFDSQPNSNQIILTDTIKPETKMSEQPITPTIADSDTDNYYYNLKSILLVQFKDSSEIKTVPQTSDVACFWCCHNFTNRPVILPIRDTGEHIQVTGNFCSPECACAYLFDMRQDSHTRWEQLALLYRVYGEACNGKIHPAPTRNALKLFGGCLSIIEYRNLIRSHKVRVDIHLPPMVSILATMDTKPIDFYDSSLTKGVTETIKERLQKAEEVLRLRRTKPLKAWESTLDACINLKIKT